MTEAMLGNLCRMPIEHVRRGNVSMVGLLRESGYLEDLEDLDAALFEAWLRANPEYLDSWLFYSNDQRSSPTWYLHEPGQSESRWAIGYVTGKPDHEMLFYPDRFAATAQFIKKYVESLTENCLNADWD